MNHKIKHVIVDGIAVFFMAIGFVGTFLVDMIFALVMALGVLIMLFNEKLNPYDAVHAISEGGRK